MTPLLPLLALTLAAGGGAAEPASGVCPMKVDGIRGGKLTAGVNIDDARSTAARKARCGQVEKVVRGLVDARAERPMRVNGFRCTPSLTGTKVDWTCVYRGGTPRTKVEALFAYRYAKG